MTAQKVSKETSLNQEWSKEDNEIEREFAEVISIVRDQSTVEKVPLRLDRRIKRVARSSALQDIEKSWILSSGARLTLVVLVFFSIAMIWLSL